MEEARRELEEELGESVITSKNATQLNTIVTELIETTAEEGAIRTDIPCVKTLCDDCYKKF